MANVRYITAKEAAALLGVKEATLYAYVSRGLIRSEAISEAPRQRLYLAEDVQTLAARKVQRRDPAKVARDALHWGTPMLESALTLITENTLYYRGYDAIQLARAHTFEVVAALLWTGSLEQAEQLFANKPLLASRMWCSADASLPTLQRLQVALALAATDDLRAYDFHPEAVAQTGARILWLMAAVAASADTLDTTIAGTLAHAWQPGTAALLNVALVLCADHELNSSAFTARVVASVEARCLFRKSYASILELSNDVELGHYQSMFSRLSLVLRSWIMPVPLAPPITLAHDEQSRLESIVRAHSTPQALAFRCQLILRAAAPDHPSHLQVANELHCNRHTVSRWRHRYLAHGLNGLQDAPRSGRPRRFSPLRASGGDGDGNS